MVSKNSWSILLRQYNTRMRYTTIPLGFSLGLFRLFIGNIMCLPPVYSSIIKASQIRVVYEFYFFNNTLSITRRVNKTLRMAW